MASNGSLTTKETAGRSITLSWYIQSQSIENNTTTIAWSLFGSGSRGGQYYVTCRKFKVIIDGTIVHQANTNYEIDLLKDEVVASGTYTISHNIDGSRSFSAYIEAGIYYSAVNSSAESTWGLTTIPRASSITSASNITLGNNCSIKWTPASSNFKYKIKFSLGNWNYTTEFITPTTTNAYTYTGYTISGTTVSNNTTIYAQLPNITYGTMTATLYTYNSDGSQIGSANSKAFTVTIPSNVVPTVGTITLDPIDIITSDGASRNILVQGKNKIKVNVSGCSAGNGSSIKSYTFSGPSISATTNNTSVTSSSVISTTGTLTYTVQVTDTRGRTASKNATIICYEYIGPHFKSFNAYKANKDGKADQNGSYIKCDYTLEYSSVNSTNNVTVKILYKKNSDHGYSSIDSILNSTSTTESSILDSIDPLSAYTVYAVITDNYNGSFSSTTITIFGESRILNITKDGLGFAVGKMSEKTDEHTNGLFECAFDAKFYKDVEFANPISIKDGGTGAETATGVLENLGLTATADELNYMDGVTSNVQVQLDNKANSLHNHGLLNSNFTKKIDNTTTDSGWSMINDNYSGYLLTSLRTQENAPGWAIGNYSAGVAFGGDDTKGVITHSYNTPHVRFAGGNGSKPVWWMGLKGAPGVTYDLDSIKTRLDNIKITQILANGSSASSCSWDSGTFDFIVGLATAFSDDSRFTFIIPQAYLGSSNAIQIADESYYTTFNTTATSITRKDGSGILDCVYGINIV